MVSRLVEDEQGLARSIASIFEDGKCYDLSRCLQRLLLLTPFSSSSVKTMSQGAMRDMRHLALTVEQSKRLLDMDKDFLGLLEHKLPSRNDKSWELARNILGTLDENLKIRNGCDAELDGARREIKRAKEAAARCAQRVRDTTLPGMDITEFWLEINTPMFSKGQTKTFNQFVLALTSKKRTKQAEEGRMKQAGYNQIGRSSGEQSFWSGEPELDPLSHLHAHYESVMEEREQVILGNLLSQVCPDNLISIFRVVFMFLDFLLSIFLDSAAGPGSKSVRGSRGRVRCGLGVSCSSSTQQLYPS